MPKALIISADQDWSSRFCLAVQASQEFALLGVYPTVARATLAIERQQPHVVLISQELATGPEFESLLVTFAAFDIRWLTVSGATPVECPSVARANSGLFTIDRLQSAEHAISLVRSICNDKSRRPSKNSSASNAQKMVLLGSSTGGIEALSMVLKDYPSDCLPTVVLQHTGTGYGRNLVSLLSRLCSARVIGARHGLPLEPGLVCVVAGTGRHALLGGQQSSPRIELRGCMLKSSHLPSIDALFESAVPFAKGITAGILTGMGRDGADGLLALRKAGARTFAQDEASSVVYGMPRAAWQNGSAEVRVPLSRISGHLQRLRCR